jgi:hypothetical protein
MADSLKDLGEGTVNAARVERTGIALVHEGEIVLPAAGSEAEAGLVTGEVRAVVNYYFPVEIEVRRGGEPDDARAVVERALSKMAFGLENI